MKIKELFTDGRLISKIQERLPSLFYLAELESSRAGKVGMEVGSIREKIIIALLIYKFGKNNVETDIPITQSEVDVRVYNEPISIKTITAKQLRGIKLSWTVDAEQAFKFGQSYFPNLDMLLVQVNWNDVGWFYLFPRDVQVEIFNTIGPQKYIQLPKAGTNTRGVEISAQGLRLLAGHSGSFKFPINWLRKRIEYNPYERWVELWQKD